MQSIFTLGTVVFSILGSTNAHMLLNTPIPYGRDTLNNSPLDTSGSDYPCKLRSGAFAISEMNKITVGQPQMLSFKGSASHGGGSCQLSITLDKEPSASSKFRVIHSIIGGCPGAGEGNSGSTSFQYQIPATLPNGKATLAWSWINKIGNREFYMNCAPIEVTGGASDTTEFDKLPEMYLANLAITPNRVAEGTEVVYPNPGKSVFQGRGGSNPAPVPPPVTPPKPTTTPAIVVSPIPPVRTSATVTSPPVPSLSATPVPSNPKNTSGCVQGSLICSADGLQFGLCNNGRVAFQPVAAGTKCVNGGIQKRNLFFAPFGFLTKIASPTSTFKVEPSSVPPSVLTTIASPTSTFKIAPSSVPPSVPTLPPSTPPKAIGCVDGNIVCGPDGLSFGICNNDHSTLQPVPAGTKCFSGKVQKRSLSRVYRQA